MRPTGHGFRTVSIRPDLAGLAWARGSVPTPRGPIRVELDKNNVRIAIPPGTVAELILPFPANKGRVIQDGSSVPATSGESGDRSVVTLRAPGEYAFAAEERR